jgi:hypothetical protein
MAAYAALLRPFGERYVLEYDRAHVLMVEHMFTICLGTGSGTRVTLDLLMAIATAMPDLQFADCWHGYLGIWPPRPCSTAIGCGRESCTFAPATV